jgi:uncharacterized membrane protein AbrB (regulator of aidB expression)
LRGTGSAAARIVNRMTITHDTRPDQLLRNVLTIDGVASGLCGVALLALAGQLAGPFGIPAAALLGFGVFALLYGPAVLYAGTRPAINRTAARVVIGLNVCMAFDSVLSAALVDVTVPGEVVLLALAAFGIGVAALQYTGLRRVLSPGNRA